MPKGQNLCPLEHLFQFVLSQFHGDRAAVGTIADLPALYLLHERGKLRAVGADIQMVDVPVEAAENEAQIS